MARTWRIGEVAERTGLTRRTLRYYDELGLLVPSQRSTGDYRLYDEDDLLRLLQIQNLKAIGLSLPEIVDALSDPSVDATATLNSHRAHLEEQIAVEQQLVSRLRTLAATQTPTWDDVLEVIALTRLHSHHDPALRLRGALDPRGRTTPELLAALNAESDTGVQEALVWALAQLPDAGPAALAELPGADAQHRRLLARLLGKTGGDAAVEALIGLLSDPDDAVVTAAVAALRALRAPAAALPLVALLGSGQVAEADLIDALAGLGGAAVDPLVDALNQAPGTARPAAVEALGRLGARLPDQNERLASALAAAAATGGRDDRAAALFALAAIGGNGLTALRWFRTDAGLGALAERLLDLHVR